MEFLYKAYADSGEVEEGRVAAAGKREAADELRSRGLHPMTIRKTGEKKKVSLFKRRRLADLAEEWESLLSRSGRRQGCPRFRLRESPRKEVIPILPPNRRDGVF